MKITKQQFVKKAQQNALKHGYRAVLVDSDVAPCDCDYEECEGWQITTAPSQYLVPNIKIKVIQGDGITVGL